MEQHLAIVAHDAAQLQRRALRLGQRLGNAQLPEEPQHEAVAGEHDEHRMPAKGGLQPATDDGRERRCDGEHHHDERHHALRLGALEAVLHDGARQNGAESGRNALQAAGHQQDMDVPGEDGQRRARREQQQ